jgi:hypothetical protein
MSSPACVGFTANQLFKLSSSIPIRIVPRVNLREMKLRGGKVGPLEPGIPTTVFFVKYNANHLHLLYFLGVLCHHLFSGSVLVV